MKKAPGVDLATAKALDDIMRRLKKAELNSLAKAGVQFMIVFGIPVDSGEHGGIQIDRKPCSFRGNFPIDLRVSRRLYAGAGPRAGKRILHSSWLIRYAGIIGLIVGFSGWHATTNSAISSRRSITDRRPWPPSQSIAAIAMSPIRSRGLIGSKRFERGFSYIERLGQYMVSEIVTLPGV